MTGATIASSAFGASVVAFTPTLVTYSTGTGATETAPAGASTVIIEVWGGGGGGHKGTALPTRGAAGSAAGYARTSKFLASSGLTFTYTVGAGGKGQDATAAADGVASSVSSGTATISTMTSNGGGNSGGAGGTASGGTAANVTGDVGDNIIIGNVPAPFGVNANLAGASGAGGSSSANTSNATAGTGGLVAFYYT